MPIVGIPNAFRATTNGAAEVEVPAGSIRSCLESLGEQAPGFLDLCLDSDGNAQRWLKFFLNEVQLADGPDVLDTEVGQGDRLELLAAVAGG
ncbi:MAG: MoaD/ThiS family protein [bacterium]|nr:MoaD/ThiS family protein [bacterium]